jgi:hypothetical protein
MKKILIILITIPLIFGSCEKEDDSPDSNNSGNNNPIVNTATGYTCNSSGQIYKTTDSGMTWTTKGYGGNSGISFP